MKKEKSKADCQPEAEKLMPFVNFNDCGGQEVCEAVCPYDVFEMRPIELEDKANLNFKGKLKTFFNKKKAYLKHPDLCHACGYCVKECPERAIKLIAFQK